MRDTSFHECFLHGTDAKKQLKNGMGLRRSVSVFKPLSFEDAERILQNVLRACGYKEAHLKPVKRKPDDSENAGRL